PLGQSYQVDVPINPGNSGGPLLNQQGQVIGVVFAGIEEYEGINFALPSTYVKDLLPRLYMGGQVKHSWLGMATSKDLDKIMVTYSYPGGPAELAGIEQGDQVISLMGESLTSIAEIQNKLFTLSPGTLIPIQINRGGEILDFILPLGVRPDTPLKKAMQLDSQDNLILPIFGMKVESAGTIGRRRSYRVSQVYPGSIADESGLVKNDNFKLLSWEVYEEQGVILMQILLQARSSGYLESVLQMGSWFEVNHFI
nr:PDZ domain-containing protein [Spirochaetaceae bacterium]